mmetsp:Transcript_10179/g.22936  ORF Transcript_10179/g.22936 Transcript_10179/m.22936 type:complete len:234 (+) Transcript_10179:847-1548(+)
MHHMSGEFSNLALHYLHLLEVAAQEVHIRQSWAGWLAESRARSQGIGLDGMVAPHVFINQSVERLERFQPGYHRDGGEGVIGPPGTESRHHEILLAAHHVDLCGVVFQACSNILHSKGAEADYSYSFFNDLAVVSFSKHAIRYVAAKRILTIIRQAVGDVQVARKEHHGRGHQCCILLAASLRGRCQSQLEGPLAGHRILLDPEALHLGAESHFVEELVLFAHLPEVLQELIS